MVESFVGVAKFILHEIPFLIFMLLLVYFFFIRPRRNDARDAVEEDILRPVNGDRLEFDDGMVGTLIKRTRRMYVIGSGPEGNRVMRLQRSLVRNISGEERLKGAYKSLSLMEKILYQI